MTDDYLVRHCAPTLAGIKTASLFTCPYDEKERLLDAIRRMNQRLRAKGLRVLPLRFSDKKALIYLYRPARLSADLRDGTAEKILRQCGYPCNSCGHCVVKLVQRLREQEEFPHEIGLFLGYPRRMSADLWSRAPNAANASAAGRSMGTKKPPKRNLPSIKSVRGFTGINGRRGSRSNGSPWPADTPEGA